MAKGYKLGGRQIGTTNNRTISIAGVWKDTWLYGKSLNNKERMEYIKKLLP